jgi:hypothetical protein
MPPLGLHMALARSVREDLGANGLAASEGEYLLGSTAPDIRVLTRWDRQVTHFFDLSSFEPQRGVEGLFHAQPQVSDAGLLNESTRAFIAGYITHLEMDECWINEVYRPYFGANSSLAGDSRANVLDRVLQYELERKVREDDQFMGACEAALRDAVMEIECGFLERETLERWREINLDVVSRPPDWQRFRQIASRHLKDAGIETVEAVDAFMAEIPDLLQETRQHVSEDRIEEFMDNARSRSREALKEYLD